MNNPSRGHPVIVVADDEAHIRLVVSEKFRSAGIEVFQARDGEEALELVKINRPDALITDLQMPYMNGLELCTQLAAMAETSRIPALLLTARGHILDQDQVARTNIRRIMSKPFSVRELFGYVTESLLAGKVAGAAPRPCSAINEPLPKALDGQNPCPARDAA